MTNILKEIINKKKERILNYKKNYSTNRLLDDIKNVNNYINFKNKIRKRNLEKKNINNSRN